MMAGNKTGRVIWHDLFVKDRQRAMEFYQRVAGWSYQTEHATDFAWGGGAKDFVLAVLDGEAGAGFVETPTELSDGWVAYVEVNDVDKAAALAEEFEGTVVRDPFDVPGVGRNALVRDPCGALIGISLSRHNFPAPQRQFGVDVYLSDGVNFPQTFYAQLFGWTLVPAPSGFPSSSAIAGAAGAYMAVQLSGKPSNGEQATWMPSLKVRCLQTALRVAEEQGAKLFSHVLSKSAQQHFAILGNDLDGASFCLQDAAWR